MSEFTHKLPHEPWHKPSRNEEEYFHRRELEERMSRARQREEERARGERDQLRAQHRDHCPDCGAVIQEVRVREGAARQCPVCLGVWLSRQMFERLTQAEARQEGGLADLFRFLLLEYTVGDLPGRHPHRVEGPPPGHP